MTVADTLSAEEVLLQFEAVWRSGRRPSLEPYLPEPGHPRRRQLLVELVRIELEHALRAGDEPPLVERYLRLYPEAFAEPAAALALITEEFQWCCRLGRAVTREEYAARFPQFREALLEGPETWWVCPHCLEVMGWKREDSRDVLVCPDCGRSSPAGSGPPTPARVETGWPSIPGYDVLGLLGRGGASVVYLARQKGLNRLVALKMIRSGNLAGPQELTRFRIGAEAVARLQHPNVVQVFEVGQYQGQPYLALEYVAGGSLAQRLDGSPLPPEEAARLVEVLARAVDHAHECGIVHRDLKPANILVAAERDSTSAASRPPLARVVPKITDFDLAKLLDGDSGQTGSGAILGTPSYMAPEQAEGRTNTSGPPSDVYALGAILYELLTGRPPFRGVSVLETLQQVRGQEPVAPCQLQRRLPRDLETVCLKCLRKEERQRYASAAALADDLARFARGEPVRARPVRTATRAWRWCRRNRIVATLLATLLLAIVGGLAATLWQWLRAEREAAQARGDRDTAQTERQRAEANLDRADEAVERMLRELGNVRLARVPQATPVRRDVLLEARRLYRELLRQKSGDPRMRARLALICGELGRVQASLGQTEDARNSLGDATRIFAELAAEDPGQLDYARQLARCHADWAAVLSRARSPAEGEEAYRAAGEILERLVREQGAQRPDVINLAGFHVNQGDWLLRLFRYGDMETHGRRALALLAPLLAAVPEDAEAQRTAAGAHNLLAIAFKQMKRRPEALAQYQRCLELREHLCAAASDDAIFRAELGTCHRNLALYWRDGGELDKAAEHYQEAHKRFTKLAAEFPDEVLYRGELAEVCHGLAICAQLRDNWAEARDQLRRAVEHQRATVNYDPQHSFYRDRLAQRLIPLADAHLHLGEHAEAAAAAYEARLFMTSLRFCADAAGLLVECIDLAEKDKRLTAAERRAAEERYTEQALEVLRDGIKRRWMNGAKLRALDLKRLYGSEAYRQLLAEADAAKGR